MEKVIERLKLMEEDETPLTQERIDGLMNKNYTSGRKIEIGDKMLFALLKENTDHIEVNPMFSSPEAEIEQPPPMANLEIKLISFHTDEIGVLYELDKISNINNKLIYLTRI